ncbi:MAG: hypothetical protein II319_02850 [Clostridia bacterium]|nr:hypothetical protein [Clostridia bacterium]
MTQLEIMGAAAKKASRFLMNAGSRKDEALLAIAKALRENSAAIIAAMPRFFNISSASAFISD